MDSNQYIIMHNKAQQYFWQGANWLSIKTFPQGQARYQIGHQEYLIKSSNFILLNHQEPYSIEIDSPKLVESFCLFFSPEMVKKVYQSLSQKQSTLLESPFGKAMNSSHFFTHLQLLTPSLARQLQQLQNRNSSNSLAVETALYKILDYLFLSNEQTIRSIENMKYIKASTRQEIYRRIALAQDYMHSNWNQPLCLDDLAKAAQLSTNHFLRSFQQIHCQTPWQYLTQLRLKRARQLLVHSKLTVSQISFEVGFQSLGSFSNLFKKVFGCSPLQLRKKGEIR